MKSRDEKLTLKLDGGVIARAKALAKKRGTSVSRMVEEYFSEISPAAPSAREGSSHPIVDSLAGIVKVPANFDWKKERTKYLLKKYGYE
jgi:hypothetical protein